MDHASSERKAFDDNVLRVAALWVCGRSGPAPYQRTTSTGAGSGGEGGEDRFNRGFEEQPSRLGRMACCQTGTPPCSPPTPGRSSAGIG